MIFLIIKGLDHLGVEKIHFCIVYKTNAAENKLIYFIHN